MKQKNIKSQIIVTKVTPIDENAPLETPTDQGVALPSVTKKGKNTRYYAEEFKEGDQYYLAE